MRQLILFMCLLFSACGGGSSGNGGGNQLPPPPMACGTADNTAFSGLQVTAFQSEVEPNDDISTAYGVTIPTPTQPGDRVVIQITGNVIDATDGVDTFSFTSSRSKQFFFKLCEAPPPAPLPGPSCNYFPGVINGNADSLDVAIAYFSVLDAAGNVLATTQANNSTENYLTTCIDGGVITYISVNANDTMNAPQNYVISASETFSF